MTEHAVILLLFGPLEISEVVKDLAEAFHRSLVDGLGVKMVGGIMSSWRGFVAHLIPSSSKIFWPLGKG